METIDLSSVPIVYLVDTNTFRYRAYAIGNLGSNNEKARQQHKFNAKAFWNKAVQEASNNGAIIMTSGETKQELKVQSHTLKKENFL